jgi:hypothetical protein
MPDDKLIIRIISKAKRTLRRALETKLYELDALHLLRINLIGSVWQIKE